jgi:hypothetical protein
MRINSKKTISITLKCRPIIFTITQCGGKRLNKPFALLPKMIEIYGMSGNN